MGFRFSPIACLICDHYVAPAMTAMVLAGSSMVFGVFFS